MIIKDVPQVSKEFEVFSLQYMDFHWFCRFYFSLIRCLNEASQAFPNEVLSFKELLQNLDLLSPSTWRIIQPRGGNMTTNLSSISVSGFAYRQSNTAESMLRRATNLVALRRCSEYVYVFSHRSCQTIFSSNYKSSLKMIAAGFLWTFINFGLRMARALWAFYAALHTAVVMLTFLS